MSIPRPAIAHPLALKPESLDRFLSYCHRRHYPNRAVVFKPGDVAGTLLYIVRGRVSLFVQEEDGKELSLGQINAREFVGEMGLFIPSDRRGVWLRTEEATEIAEIEVEKLQGLMLGALQIDAVPLLHALGLQLARRLLETTRKASGLALLDVGARIWRALEDLAKSPSAMTHPKGMQIKVSRRDLAKMAGCSREMAGRVIKRLVDEGKIYAHGKTMVVYETRRTYRNGSN